jgi:mono/diheme cytochrome c family protein
VRRIRDWASGSIVKTGLLVIVIVLVVIQLVPYGHDHSNPPVTQQLKFDSSRTEQLTSDACGACHSNLTSWPVESNLAPFSWLIQRDVEEGRSKLNFSEWNRPEQETDEIASVITEGEMPPMQYKLLHPSARLSDSEKADLADGLTKSIANDPPGG